MSFTLKSAKVILLLLLVAVGCNKPTADDGTKPFQGSWQAIGSDGKKVGKEAIFDKDIFQLIQTTTKGAETQASASPRMSFRVDASKTPAHIDFVSLDGENQGKTKQGIFAFENDQLKLCVADFDAPRPNGFAAAENTLLIVLERKQ